MWMFRTKAQFFPPCNLYDLNFKFLVGTSSAELKMAAFQNKGVAVPSQLRHKLFTVGALDNLDHNPTSTTARGSFHGTGINLFQFPITLNSGVVQDSIKLHLAEQKNHKLPESFTTVPVVALHTEKVLILHLSTKSLTSKEKLEDSLLKEASWLVHACQQLEKEEVTGDAIHSMSLNN